MRCATDPDHDDGAELPLLVFAHGNSFPAPSYRKLLGLLGEVFEVAAPERFGHDPAYPVSDSWPHLLAELHAFVRRVAQRRRVVLLDAPIVSGWRAALLWGSKRSGLAWRTAPAAAARRRRDTWADVEAVRAHFGSKDIFARWDPEMLDDYARLATEARDGARVLRFARDVEAQIYATLPHGLGRLLRRPPQVPIGFIAGRSSRELRMAGMRATQRLVGPHLRWIDGTHLFPFEHPRRTAQTIVELWRALEEAPSGSAPERRARSL